MTNTATNMLKPLAIILILLTLLIDVQLVEAKHRKQGVTPGYDALFTYAQKYIPYGLKRTKLIEQIEKKKIDFDTIYNTIRVFRPNNANQYHSTLVNRHLHPTRDGIRFALDLLDAGDPAYREMAFKIINSVLRVQDSIPTSANYGLYPYFLEEPLTKMKTPDGNWADFISVSLLEIYLKHQLDLPAVLSEKIKKSLIASSQYIMKRNVKPSYTNISIMGSFVTYLTADLFQLESLRNYAVKRFNDFYLYTKEINGFEEYNSPTYTLVALDELQRMRQFITNSPFRSKIDFCYNKGWEVLGNHFHVPTAQLSGPHSRTYSDFLNKEFYNFLYGASEGRIKYGDATIPMNYYRLQHKIPKRYLNLFCSKKNGSVKYQFSEGNNPVTGYAYLNKNFCFGTVNRSTTWMQRRPYLMYFKNSVDTFMFKVSLLHDFVDFAAGNIFSSQNKSKALTALNFATDGGDYHISLDRIKNGTFIATDLRLRFEIKGKSICPDTIMQNDNSIIVPFDDMQIKVNMIRAEFDDFKIRTENGGDKNSKWVDFVIYSGQKKEFNLKNCQKALFAWSTTVNQRNSNYSNDVNITETTDKLLIENKSDKLLISCLKKPAPEKILQSTTIVK